MKDCQKNMQRDRHLIARWLSAHSFAVPTNDDAQKDAFYRRLHRITCIWMLLCAYSTKRIQQQKMLDMCFPNTVDHHHHHVAVCRCAEKRRPLAVRHVSIRQATDDWLLNAAQSSLSLPRTTVRESIKWRQRWPSDKLSSRHITIGGVWCARVIPQIAFIHYESIQ